MTKRVDFVSRLMKVRFEAGLQRVRKMPRFCARDVLTSVSDRANTVASNNGSARTFLFKWGSVAHPSAANIAHHMIGLFK